MPDHPIDEAAFGQLLETVGGDEEFLAELIGTYLADSPNLLAEMRSAIESGETETLRRAAHTLKSTSATFGASRLAGIAREIEAAAAGGDLDGIPARVEVAAAEYEIAAAALRERMAGAAST